MARLTRAGWYWNRLRNLSVLDLVGKAGGSAGQALARRSVAAEVPPYRVDKIGARWLPAEILADDAFVARADELLSGDWRILAMGKVQLGFPPEWNRNPSNAVLLPLATSPASTREAAAIGDMKYLWAPNRHRELVTLAQAWKATGRRIYLDAIGSLLTSWFKQCPYPHGANWARPAELAIRLINWATVWQLVGGARSPLFEKAEGMVFKRDWLESIWRHAEFIQCHLSRSAAATSPLIAELAGLYVAGATWPFWSEAKSWRRQAREGLECEALRQNSEDGVNLEQSTVTQLFVWDALLFAGLAARASGRNFSSAYWQRLEAMAEYVAALMDRGGNLPMFGDGDDGQLSGLALGSGVSAHRSQLATAALLFSRPAFAHKAGVIDLRTRSLLGEKVCDGFNSLLLKAFPTALKNSFPEGGIYVLGAHLDTPDELRVVADAGPLGSGGLAANGHADALSFTLSLAGREFLVDPGNGTHQGPRAWRDGFRGTAMHNTLGIADEDQALSAGRRMWVKKFSMKVLSWSSDAKLDCLVAEHDGYRRLAGRPVHRRTWNFDKLLDRLVVRDEIISSAPQPVALNWHFSEQCELELTPLGAVVSNGPIRMSVMLPPDGEVTILQGSDMPLGGWVSRAYDQRSPATTLVWRGTLHGGHALETAFRRI